jgi:hypothetical protein
MLENTPQPKELNRHFSSGRDPALMMFFSKPLAPAHRPSDGSNSDIVKARRSKSTSKVLQANLIVTRRKGNHFPKLFSSARTFSCGSADFALENTGSLI